MGGLPGLWACRGPLYADLGGLWLHQAQLHLQLIQNWVSASGRPGGVLRVTQSYSPRFRNASPPAPTSCSHMHTKPPLSIGEPRPVKPDAGVVRLCWLSPGPPAASSSLLTVSSLLELTTLPLQVAFVHCFVTVTTTTKSNEYRQQATYFQMAASGGQGCGHAGADSTASKAVRDDPHGPGGETGGKVPVCSSSSFPRV